jgi:signal transduction histidine kinase
MAQEQSFKQIEFTVDAALLRELGERLVGKPHVALAELVKNSYDADANKCTIVFGEDEIEVRDDGSGMTFEEFKNFWMRIGTTHKQKETKSPLFHRPVTGSKGIGRLSVQFLGRELEMWSVARDANRALHVKVDWAETHKSKELMRATADWRMESPKDKLRNEADHGTRLVVRGLNQEWGETAVRDLARELWFLQPPKELQGTLRRASRFKVELRGAGEDAMRAFEKQMHAVLQNWDALIEGGIKRGRSGEKAKVKVKFSNGAEFEHEYPLPHKKLDEANFTIRIFKLAGKQPEGITVGEARQYFAKYGGVHVYDGGFRLPFYGGEEQDWLGLEIVHSHRLMVSKLLPEELQVPGGMQDMPTLSRVFGSVRVSTSDERRKAPKVEQDKGEYLNIQVTRDRLIDNKPFDDLVHLVRWAFDFYAHRAVELKQKRAAEEAPRDEDQRNAALLEVREALARVEKLVPKKEYEKIQKQFDEFEETDRLAQEGVAKERILLGALATAGMGAVALEHELGKEIAALRDHVSKLKRLADGPLKDEIGDTAKALEDWAERALATRQLFSPLMNQIDRERKERLSARKVVQAVATLMKPLMRKTEIELDDVPKDLKLPIGTMAAWYAIFQNVLMNSINAMLDQNVKRVRCSGGVQGGRAYLLIEDTGVGVDLETADELFKPFVRKLDISEERRALGLGGVGLGLTIVRMVAASLNCEAAFVKPSRLFHTAFELRWENKQ